MSDHWKSILNQFGIPGPADPPAKRTPEADAKSPSGNAAEPEKPKAVEPRAEKPVSEKAAAPAKPAAKRSSMWGDDGDDEPAGVDSPAASSPATPASAAPAASQSSGDDPLEAIVSIDRGPTVPGFDPPRSDSPERPKTPIRRSAWDALIGTLGIKAPPETEHPPADSSRSDTPSRPARQSSAERPNRPTERIADTEPVAADDSGGFAAGLLAPPAASGREPSANRESTADREPRSGRGRRTGVRGRTRQTEEDREPVSRRSAPRGRSPERSSDEDFDWELASDDDDVADTTPAKPAVADDDRRERPRRSRRRGQRQLLSVDDVDSGRDRPEIKSDTAADEPRAGRRGSARRPVNTERDSDRDSERPAAPRGRRDSDSDSDDRPRRSPRGGADRGSAERGSAGRGGSDREGSRRGDGGSRDVASREESTARAPARGGRSGRGQRDDDRDPVDDDFAAGFGSGLLDDLDDSPASRDDRAASPDDSSGDDEPRRPRRRRGRRGRGGSGSREEGSRDDAAPVSAKADLDEVEVRPGFDDDLEDDDEADRLRRRSRGGRSRGPRRESAAGREPAEDRDTPTGDATAAVTKPRSVPTWLDTVGLLVDSNIQRRPSGGDSRGGRGSGRGGRR